MEKFVTKQKHGSKKKDRRVKKNLDNSLSLLVLLESKKEFGGITICSKRVSLKSMPVEIKWLKVRLITLDF